MLRTVSTVVTYLAYLSLLRRSMFIAIGNFMMFRAPAERNVPETDIALRWSAFTIRLPNL